MVRLALEGDTLEKRRQAVKNCVVLTREAPTARKLLEQGVPMRFLPLLQDEDEDMRVHALHVYGGLAELGVQAGLVVLAALQQGQVLDTLMTKVRAGGSTKEVQGTRISDRHTRRALTLSLCASVYVYVSMSILCSRHICLFISPVSLFLSLRLCPLVCISLLSFSLFVSLSFPSYLTRCLSLSLCLSLLNAHTHLSQQASVREMRAGLRVYMLLLETLSETAPTTGKRQTQCSSSMLRLVVSRTQLRSCWPSIGSWSHLLDFACFQVCFLLR